MRWVRGAVVVGLFLALALPAAATVVQVDGQIIPLTNRLQTFLNSAEGVSPPSTNALYAVLDASQLPEVFLPNTTSIVRFCDIGEGAGFENSVGYYNVGDDVTDTSSLRPILGCGVAAADHANEVPNYFVDAEPNDCVDVDFGAEATAGRYAGGFIGFYLIAPEGRGSAPNCGDFAGASFFGRIYFTQRDLNNDGDFVHHLVYQSRLVDDRFYFGFEDLFRGGDNDFEDMLIQVTGLTPPCTPGVEVCDGRDNDCDGLVDADDPNLSGVGTACVCDGSGGLTCEGGNRTGACTTGIVACVSGGFLCRSTVGPQAEVCDGVDDNCNGVVDDGAAGTGVACDGSDGDLCPEGVTECTAGTLTCSDTTGPNAETCNGLDDDCDGATDETPSDVGLACDGADGDLCPEGTTACVAGALTCTDVTGTDGELCNGADDDCDTRTDESPSDVGVACAVGVGRCRRTGATECSAGMSVCNVSAGTPVAELCNTVDDDCDGAVDEDFSLGVACVAPGICGPGVVECEGSTATRCSTAPSGSADASAAEACNNLDDDCDGRTDEGLSDLGPCGSDVGECAAGRLRCVAGASTCSGGVGPTPEVCDGLDNDCDGLPDERVGDAGNVGDGLVDEGGACGPDVGECSAGSEVCVAGALVCTGATGPSAEVCDALDNDCNGVTDDSPSDVGASCGLTDVGACELGLTICVSGSVQCAGGIDPEQELCNGSDDDCDGRTDEDPLDVGRVCGSAMGTCTPGVTICQAGTVVCDGATPGSPEVCNGIDDDCNNVIDDEPSDAGGACGSGTGVCEQGTLQCISGALECVGGVLPGTEICNGIDDDCNGTIDDGNLCEGGVCANARCSSPCQSGEFPCPFGQRCEAGFCVDNPCFGVQCESDADGTRRVCREAACVPVCDAQMCTPPSVCRRTDGACVGNNCTELPYLCVEGEVCQAGVCVADPCLGVSCDADAFCVGGTCRGSCVGIVCGSTAACRGGQCEPTGCATACGAGERCIEGACTEAPCTGVFCGLGEVCEPQTGNCIVDPCSGVTCPEGGVCEIGECVDAPVPPPPVAADAGPGPQYIIATGGCAVGASGSRSRTAATPVWLFVGFALCFLGLRRRRRLRSFLWVLACALPLSGCVVDPFCIEDCQRAKNTPEAGVSADASTSTADGGTDAPDACVPGTVESCDALDNDCDGLIDEDFDLTQDLRHCGACDQSCIKAGAQTECREGTCGFLQCFAGNLDLNGDTSGAFADTDGCEYACFASNGGVEACDGLDNDCDGRSDEDTDLMNDHNNCGVCGRVCNFFRASGGCDAGVCRFNPATDCDAGFIDQNGVQFDGCEFECSPTGAEVCDGLDNDCDTRTDEGFNLDTDVTHCGRCGRACSFPNATPSCVAGVCGFNPATDCDAGFVDRDGVQLNGCELNCTPTADPTEICDGVDNDCDGQVDGATTDAGGTCNASPSGTPTGACAQDGRVVCIRGALTCVDATVPRAERCNGVDDDCNGAVDDSPVDEGRVCQNPVGTCSAGFEVCQSGMLVCQRAVGPSAELCNGLDDDCDGAVDNAPTDASLGTTCGTDVGACTAGVVNCTSGALVCAGEVAPRPETCNSIDDDCDGAVDNAVIDEGASCGSSVGACQPGSETCVGGSLVCIGGVGPSAESCNGLDDNCDGSVDEGLMLACYSGPAATRGVGRCRDGVAACVAGSAGTCVGEVLPAAETCDNVDEDCDGAVDEGLFLDCYTGPVGTEGVGRCVGGAQACMGGAFSGSCLGEVVPGSEACNGLDDDCDGAVDETSGGGPLTQICYGGDPSTIGVGPCVAGVSTCAFGTFGLCVGQTTPETDRCGDGIDSDCDGDDDTAEGCLSAGGESRVDTGDAAGASHSFDVRLAFGGSPSGRNVYAVWTDLRNGNADIFLARSTDGGSTFGGVQNLTSGTGNRAVAPELALARNGANDRVVVAYQRVSSGRRQVWVSRSSDSGATFASAQRLDTTSNTDNFKHHVASDEDGQRVVVAWEQLDTNTLARHVVSRASVDAGVNWSAERRITVNTTTNPIAGRPRVLVTDGGRFVFVWREARSPRSTFDVFATYSDSPSDAIVGARESRLDSDGGDTRASDNLAVVGAEDDVYVAWQDLSTVTTGDADIVFSASADGAVSWRADQIVDDPAAEVSSSFEPTLDLDPQGAGGADDRLYLAWSDTREGLSIYLARSLDGGSTFGAPLRASNEADDPVPGVSDQPRVVWAGGDDVLVAYVNDPNPGTSEPRVRVAASIDAGATFQITDPVVDQGGGAASAPAIVRADGSLLVGGVVAWVDNRSGTFINGDVYRARVGR